MNKTFLLLTLFLYSFSVLCQDSKTQFEKAKFDNDTQKTYFSIYTTGEEFCSKYSEITKKENGFRIDVPMDYNDLKKGKTSIYAFWAEGKYDPALPTMIFFDGGSGGNSHEFEKFSSNYNQLHFDQRGVGCSRPATLDLYRDKDFYSTVNNARDAMKVLEHLSLDKVSVVGASYGTEPATVFAHLFPERITALVLEGVVYDGPLTDKSEYISFFLKKMYKRLPKATQEAMKSYFTVFDKSYGLHMIAVYAMYQNNGISKMAEKLVEVFPDKEHIDKEKADKYFDPSFIGKQFFEGDDVSTVDMVNNMVLTCKETRNKQQTITLFMADENGNMVYDFYPHRQEPEYDECDDLGFEADQIPYSAKNYPFTVPVTYFQGTHDGATHPKGAVWHYRHAAKGRAQLLLAKNGGHSPNLSADEGISKAQQLVFEKALRGENITKEDLGTISTKEIKWSMTSRK